jgi:hypothetical protein
MVLPVRVLTKLYSEYCQLGARFAIWCARAAAAVREAYICTVTQIHVSDTRQMSITASY